jgi:hypothetical protein
MPDDTERQDFDFLRAQYFDPLCERLGLIPGEPKLGDGFARVSADSGTVRLYFEYERGLGWFAIGAVSDSQPLCSIEDIAERFPRLRLMSEGAQRLSFEEQRSLICDRWEDLQLMFSPEHLRATRQWWAAVVATYMKKFTVDRRKGRLHMSTTSLHP